MQPIQAAHETALRQLADELVEASQLRRAVPPLRGRLTAMDLQDAYDIQTFQLEDHLAEGRVLAGRKIGLTSLAMQKQLGVDQPDFGFFFEDMVHTDEANIPAGDFISPKVEPEFGFLLAETLKGPGVTREQAAAAIGAVYPAIEIIDSRIVNWDITLVDTVADNASCGAIAVGRRPLPITVEDLKTTECTLRINGAPKGTGTGAAVMGDPVAPLVWLANLLGEQGVALEAGQIVLPGSFTAAQPVVAGESATADFGQLGSLTIHFV